MRIDLAFFDQDTLLARGSIDCSAQEQKFSFKAASGYRFDITSQFDDPACPVSISYISNDELLYKSALRVGLHSSEDWESIDLGNIHTLVFWCHA